jgi:hypothetical protein
VKLGGLFAEYHGRDDAGFGVWSAAAYTRCAAHLWAASELQCAFAHASFGGWAAAIGKPLDREPEHKSSWFNETLGHAVITYLRLALRAGILKSNSRHAQLRRLLARKYEVVWHVNLQRRISKRHFLGYAARYIRRPPIAEHRFREIDGPVVKFVTKDTATKQVVLDQIPKRGIHTDPGRPRT